MQSSYEVATLVFPSLDTSDAKTAAVKNGVSIPESQVCGLVSRIEMCGYILKEDFLRCLVRNHQGRIPPTSGNEAGCIVKGKGRVNDQPLMKEFQAAFVRSPRQ